MKEKDKSVRIISINKVNTESYTNEVYNLLESNNLKVSIDTNDNLSFGERFKIGRNENIYYFLIIGDKDKENRCVGLTVRGKTKVCNVPFTDLLYVLKKEPNNEKKIKEFINESNYQWGKIFK